MIEQDNIFNGCDVQTLNKYFQFILKIEKDYEKKLDHDTKLKIENHKLAIMQSTLTLLQPSIKTKRHNIKKESTAKNIFVYVSSLINPLIAATGGFSLCGTLLNFIPGMLHPVALGCGIVSAVIVGAISMAYDAGRFKRMLGISTLKMQPIIELYQQQLGLIKKIKLSVLSNHHSNRYCANDYTYFQNTINLFNQDVKEKHKKLVQCYKKTPAQKNIKRIMTGINVVLSAGSGFLMSNSLFILFGGALLVAGPVGWVVGSLFAIFSVAAFHFIQKREISSLMNIITGRPKELIGKQARFLKDLKQYDSELQTFIDKKKKDEFETKQSKQKIVDLQNKVIVPDLAYPHQQDSKYNLASQSVFRRNRSLSQSPGLSQEMCQKLNY